MIQCILFDLDGTLLDTSHDFYYALNQTCAKFNVPNVDYQQLRPIISDGGQAMVSLAFPETSSSELAERKAFFLANYADNIAKHTQLFTGLESGMQAIADKEIAWGIVTNKPEWLTQRLMQQIVFPSEPCAVISGDSLAESKPHPAPLLLAAKNCGVKPENCLFLGDHSRDILAGKNANMQTGVALFGFIPTTDKPQDWQADYNFTTPESISKFLKDLNKK